MSVRTDFNSTPLLNPNGVHIGYWVRNGRKGQPWIATRTGRPSDPTTKGGLPSKAHAAREAAIEALIGKVS